ncbi:hypothetical protein P7C70_g5558, partial [Phenoliferia sp. Uapishka_3]
MDPALLATLQHSLPPSEFNRLMRNPDMMAQLVDTLGRIGLAPLAGNFSRSSFDDQAAARIANAKQRFEEEKRRPPRLVPETARATLISNFETNRGTQMEIERSREHITYTTYCGVEKDFSQLPWSVLRPDTSLVVRYGSLSYRSNRELFVQGRYLLIRTVTQPRMPNLRAFIAGLTFMAEDEKGRVDMISIYNINLKSIRCGPELDQLFPVGTVLAIREPTYKMAATGPGTLVRIDSPTDALWIGENHPLFKSAQWKFPGPAQAVVDFRAVGNVQFGKGQFRLAAKTYSRGIEARLKLSDQILLHLNRSAANLGFGAFKAAYSDAEIVLTMLESGVEGSKTSKIKALQRRAVAEEKMGHHQRALKHFEELFAYAPDCSDAQKGMKRISAKLEQAQSGNYDWVHFFKSSFAGDDSCRHDVADFVGPCRIAKVAERGGGRGVLATEDIKPGEVLLLERAFACEFPSLNHHTLAMDFQKGVIRTATQTQLVATIIAKVMDDPSLLKVINALYAGENMPGPSDFPTATLGDLDSDSESCDIDTARVEGVCSFNSFGGLPSRKISNSAGVDEPDSSSKASGALFARSSLFNHSCVPNALWTMYGDVIVIRSRIAIKSNDEIFLPYFDALDPGTRKDSGMRKFFPNSKNPCACALCVADQIDGLQNLTKRIKLIETRLPALWTALRKALATSGSPTTHNHRMAQAFVREIDGTHNKMRVALRPSLAHAYHLLAESTSRGSPNRRRAAPHSGP